MIKIAVNTPVEKFPEYLEFSAVPRVGELIFFEEHKLRVTHVEHYPRAVGDDEELVIALQCEKADW